MQLLTPNQVSDQTGIPVRRLYALVREGLIPAVHCGRQIRFSREALEQWIAGGGQSLPGGWRRDPSGSESVTDH